MAGDTTSFGAANANGWLVRLDSSGSVSWERSYGGSGSEGFRAVIQTADGGFLAGGYTLGSWTTGWSMWLLKLDAMGAVLWEKTYDRGDSEVVRSMLQTSDGGYIVAGDDGNDAHLMKLASDGSVVWHNEYGFSSSYGEGFLDVLETAGGYIATGYADPDDDDWASLWVVAFDSSGAITWQKTYDLPGTYDRWGTSIVAGGAGYMVAGKSGFDAWVLSIDATGGVVWQKTYGVGSGGFEAFHTVVPATDGGVVVGGSSGSYGAGSGDAWLLRIDSSGGIVWQKTYGGTGMDSIEGLVAASDGGYFAAAYTESAGAGNNDLWALKVDGNGDIGSVCSYVGTSTATPADQTVTVASPAATTWTTTMAVADSAATVTNTASTTDTQCSGAVSVSVSPGAANVMVGGTRQFTASVAGTTTTTVTWRVNDVAGGNATVGTIDAGGLYAAPSSAPTPATVTIKAVSDADGVTAGAAELTVVPPTCLGYIVTVDSTADTVDSNIGDGLCDDGSGNCTLRAAVQETNACSGADFIEVLTGTYTLAIGGTGEELAVTGDLDITDDLTLTAAYGASVIVDGGGIDRVFDLDPGSAGITVKASEFTIQNGNSPVGGGVQVMNGVASFTDVVLAGNSATAACGGLYNYAGTVTITDSIVSGNNSSGSGGGFCTESGLTITGSSVTGNIASSGSNGGGALYNNGGTVSIVSSRVRGNRAPNGYGGGIYNLGTTLALTNSTVDDNGALVGGGIANYGSLVVAGSTISHNRADNFGGGIDLSGAGATLSMTNSTISGNTTTLFDGGGINNTSGAASTIGNSTITGNGAGRDGGGILNSSGTVNMTSTVVSGNAGGDCSGLVTDNGGSLDGDGSCGAGSTGNPLLDSLADNGGPTQTHALQAGSPAIDAGDNGSCPATDQRGVARSDGSCDIGAYEYP